MFGTEENSGSSQEATPTPTVEPPIDPTIMQGLGITQEAIQNYRERENSALHAAFQEGSRTYNSLKQPGASETSIKLGQVSIELDTPAHNAEDLVQQAAELLQRKEHEPSYELIRTHLKGLGVEAIKDQQYQLVVRALNIATDSKLDQETNLLNILGEKARATFPQKEEAENVLVKLALTIKSAKEIPSTPTPTPIPSPTSESATGTLLRPITPLPGSQN